MPESTADLAEREARRRLDAMVWADANFEIRNATGDAAEVYIYGAIGYDVVPIDFVQQLAEITAPQIDVHIHSPGGSVFDGIAILNALRSHEANIVVTVDGVAASAASFIAMAGDEIIVSPNAEMMVHDPSGLCVGGAADMRHLADMLDHAGDNIASMYAARAGGTVEEWRAAMAAETWYSAEEAVAVGLADRVGALPQPNPKPQANFDLSVFNFSGRREAPGPQHPATVPVNGPHQPQEGTAVDFTPEQITNLRQSLDLPEDADETAIRDALIAAAAQEPPTPPETPTLPEGVVTIDAAQLEQLRNDAQAGVEARNEQLRVNREQTVNAAVADGRIAPARRDHWVAQLEADPGAEAVLASLEKGLVPVSQIGRGGNADLDSEAARADADYEAIYGKKEVSA